jgi:hypothetical protein
MALFSKPKDGKAPVPKRCHRCRKRLGTARLHVVAPAATPLRESEREAWLCDECQADVRHSAANN